MAPTLQGLIECFVTQLVGPVFHCPAGDAKYRREGPVDGVNKCICHFISFLFSKLET